MTDPTAASAVITGDDIHHAWSLTSRRMQRVMRELESAFPHSHRELLLACLAISVRSIAEAAGYAPDVAELLNAIWEHDPQFRWRLVDVRN